MRQKEPPEFIYDIYIYVGYVKSEWYNLFMSDRNLNVRAASEVFRDRMSASMSDRISEYMSNRMSEICEVEC